MCGEQFRSAFWLGMMRNGFCPLDAVFCGILSIVMALGMALRHLGGAPLGVEHHILSRTEILPAQLGSANLADLVEDLVKSSQAARFQYLRG